MDVYTKMEICEHPQKFVERVLQMGNELERVERPVYPNDVDIVNLYDLTSK